MSVPPPPDSKETSGYSSGGLYDIVFAEAELPRMDGISAMRELRAAGHRSGVILMHQTDKYALEGYRVFASGYLLKPLSKENVFHALDKALVETRIDTRKKRMIVYADGINKVVYLEDIRYIEVNGHMLRYNTSKGTIFVRGKLDDAEAFLAPHGFFRIYKCYLVNLDYIAEIKDKSLIVNGEELLVSRFKRKDLMAAFKQRAESEY